MNAIINDMSDRLDLVPYEKWKTAKRRRKTWMAVIAFFLALLFAYIAGNLLCKVGLMETKKIFSYGWGTKEEDLKSENQKNLPNDYIEWHTKVKENVWVKNFGRKEDYFTKGEIAKRKAEKEKKELGIGEGILGDLASWWLTLGLTEEEAKKVDYYYYSSHVYSYTSGFLILSWFLFYLFFYLLSRYLILPLIWREPKLKEKDYDY